MFLKQLSVVNYKSHQKESFEFARKVNCIVGRNGSGKTNLLDAIYYLCLTKSYFSATENQNIRHGQGFFSLSSEIACANEVNKITCKVRNDKKKELFKDDIRYERLSEHIGAFPAVFITPNDISLIYGGSDERRKFLDGLISQIDTVYLGNLQRYNKLLLQRNSLLKRFAETQSFDASLLQVYSDKMLEPGNYIFEKRARVIEEFIPLFTDIYKAISGGREEVGVHYDSEITGKSLEALFSDNIEHDRFAKRTTSGVHKDDLDFLMGDHVIRKFGSQGQQKSFLISVKLCQYQLIKKHREMSPFLLLDDIFDKLDDDRSANLLSFITSEDFGQIFITDTRKERLERIFKDKLNLVDFFGMETAEIN